MTDFGAAVCAVDGRAPRATSVRTGNVYRPGIGPHSETEATRLVIEEMAEAWPSAYAGRCSLGVGYSSTSRQKCDLCIGLPPGWEWAIEIKMLRLMGDNGKPNDNMLMHILSPYAKDRSALTDCAKLVGAELQGRKAVLIYGFDYPGLLMDPAIEAFELLASKTVTLGKRQTARLDHLVHPVHQAGRVFGWEVASLSGSSD